MSRNAKVACTRVAIKVVNQRWQENQHQYTRAKWPNSPVDIAGESRVRITIVEDVAAKTNIARITRLAAAMRKFPKSIRQSKI
jgi:hypothetical protein